MTNIRLKKAEKSVTLTEHRKIRENTENKFFQPTLWFSSAVELD